MILKMLKKSKVAPNLWEKASFPVDVLPSKAPLLKFPIDVLLPRIYANVYQVWSTLAGY